MKDCVFCKIIKGEIPCYKIYEDDFCLAFLDVTNDAYGHTLVVPKKHTENVMTCDSATLSRLIEVAKKIGTHYVQDCGFDGFHILNNCGSISMMKHIHFHIFPRKEGDGKEIYPDLGKSGAELQTVCDALKIVEKPKAQPHENVDKDTVILYTDGACSGNPGAGGWSAILTFGGKEKIFTGGEADTTNNRMELMAVIVGLENVKKGNKVAVFSDSAYVVNAFLQDWIGGWKKHNWKNSAGDVVANKELWFRLLSAMEGLYVTFNKVKGHSDNEYNNRCDALARDEILKLS